MQHPCQVVAKCLPYALEYNYQRKDKKMNVTVTNLDKTHTVYGFSPEHKSEAIGFYTKLYWEGKISGFIAGMDNGEIVAIGAN